MVELYWIPLGAGASPVVRCSGRCYEAVVARRQGRRPLALYHAALIVTENGAPHAIEVGPAWAALDDEATVGRGAVGSGPVGLAGLGRFRRFRYEIRCRRGGRIPDLGAAVGGPRRLSTDPAVARRLLAAVPLTPTVTWGRDELATGEMWNSNSVVAWLLARAGLDPGSVPPPPRGRAPGWRAGTVAARRVRSASGR